LPKKGYLTLFAILFIVVLACPRLMFGPDTDRDGIINAFDPDSDGDGIDDGREVKTGTSPIDTDSDGDHYSDTLEYAVWNPNAPNREDRYYRCPYIADLLKFDLQVVDDWVI